jgi:hypothetical protein
VIHTQPRFEIELPAGWEPAHDSAARFVHGDAEIRLADGLPLERELAEHRHEQELTAKISGRPATLRFESFAGPEDRLLRLQVRFEGDDFHLEAVCRAADAATYAPVFVTVAHSIHFV